jgi:carboxypeptidase C (cathepsin A)
MRKNILIFLSLFSFLFAENQEIDNAQKIKVEQKNIDEKELFNQTQHSIILNEKTLSYTASLGTFIIESENKKSSAKIFYVSYAKNCDDSKERPITFVFNGGPGSASVWLHMGALGPKKIISFENNQKPVPPYTLIDNEETILDFTDLVFIDPVGAGFSQVITGEAEDFYGLNEDTKAVGDFICKYLTFFKKWPNPKYIIGESYGGMRAICLTSYLQDHYYLFFNGICLISPVINFGHYIDGNKSSILPYVLILPTYSATAWYHNLLSNDFQQKSLEDIISISKDFALNDYSLALLKGDLISDMEKERIITKLSELTGLPKDYIQENNLRIRDFSFIFKLLPKDKNTDLIPIIGMHDTRVKGYTEVLKENPSIDWISGAYSAIINDYLREELGYVDNEPYLLLNELASQSWKWDQKGSLDYRKVDLSTELRHVLSRNPSIKILIGCGYFDLATPFFTNKYAINHLHLPISFRKNIKFEYYETGHMPYLDKKAHKKLKKDLFVFFNEN